MTFEVTILGCGAATPTTLLNPSAQVVDVHDKLYLVDCGEGTQMQMRKCGVKFQRINHVFVSHLHGDHYLGLQGYISSMHLLGRKTPLHIYAPSGLKDITELNLKLSQTFLDYELHFHKLNFKKPEVIFEDKTMEVHSIPLKHRIECCGFIFREKLRQPNILKEAIKRFGLQPTHILDLKKGLSVKIGSVTVKPEQVSEGPPLPRSYAYISDTAYAEKLVPALNAVTLLYHESTFLDNEKDRAKKTFHSTASQAARIAAKAGVRQLLLGHFSSRYRNQEVFLEEAKNFFSDCILAREGATYKVG